MPALFRVKIITVKQVINIDANLPHLDGGQPSGGTCHISMASVTATSAPADIAEWMDPVALSNCVVEEVAHFCQSGEVPEDFSTKEPNRRELLGVLTFAYARRIYDSEEIAQRCQTEPAFRGLCHDHKPFTSELIRFRRHYRPLLITVLANVLMRATQTLSKEATLSSSAALKRQLLCQATSRLDTARHLDSGSE